MTTPRFRIPRRLTAAAVGLVAVLGVMAAAAPGGARPAASDVARQSDTASEEAPAGSEAADAAATGTDGASDPLADVVASEAYEVYLARDPFEPVVPVAAAATDSGTGVGSSAAPADDGPAASGGSDAATDTSPQPSSPDDSACRGTEEVVCDGQVVTLVDVDADAEDAKRASIRVDTTVYEVEEQQIFADNFGVLAIDSSCVTLLYGDDVFSLCEGEATLK